MSSINSSSYYSVSSGTSGISGLMSGMDTDALVEQMLSGTQTKIDRAEAEKQQLEWKQDLYREVIDEINSFYNKYFDTSYGSTLSTNFATTDFFNTMISSVTSGSAVKVSGTSNSALSGDLKIAVTQLATAASLKSSEKLSGNQTIVGNSTLEDGTSIFTSENLSKNFEETVSLKVGSTTVDVNLNHVTNEDELAKAFNDAFKAAGVSGATAEIYEGKLRIVSDSSTSVTVDSSKSTAKGLALTGFSDANTSNVTNTAGAVVGKSLQGTGIDFSAGLSFDITLDGVTKTIDLSDVKGSASMDGYTITSDDVLATINDQISRAFGTAVEASFDTSSNNLVFGIGIKNADGTTEAGHELIITGSNATLLGIKPGSSSSFNTSQTLGEVGSGDKFEFSINGVDFSFDGDTTVASMIDTVNRSSAGVTLNYSTLSDTMSITANNTGSSFGIDMKQTSGNILSELFGDSIITPPSSVASEYLTTATVKAANGGLDSTYETTSASLSMTVNGETKTFTLTAKEGDATYSASEVSTAFNTWLTEEFDGNITYNTTTGNLDVKEGYLVEFNKTDVNTTSGSAVAEAQKTDLALAMGFNFTDNSNIATEDTLISDVYYLKDEISKFSSTSDTITTLGDLTGKTDNPPSSTTYDGFIASFSGGRLVLSENGEVMFHPAPPMDALFGSDDITLGTGASAGSIAAGAVTEGKDASVIINGVETTRSSNSFEIDGVSMQLTSVSEKDDAGNYVETTVSTVRDDDVIIDAFKGFVEDYNKMVELLNGYVSEDADYKDYPPLTDAQKEEMTDREIELWEEKTQVGLLRNDSTITTFLSQLRTAVYTKPDDSSLALYQIGIETSSFFDDEAVSGTLTIDEDALRQALSNDPTSVMTLFTSSQDGLAAQFDEIVNSVANTSSANPGTLVALAGVEGRATEDNNDLSSRLDDIESTIETLKYRYEQESARYWASFTAMETALSNYNTDLGYLTQQFGSGY